MVGGIEMSFVVPYLYRFPSQQPSSMAYNREWDQGKETWNDSAWNATGVGAHVRPREEDYYGEGKRRKFNSGVCSQL